MACESEKKELKAAKEAFDKIHKYNLIQYFQKTKEEAAANKRLMAASTALSRCRSGDPADFDRRKKAITERLQKEFESKSSGVSPKKTGGFRNEWLEPPCCPEI